MTRNITGKEAFLLTGAAEAEGLYTWTVSGIQVTSDIDAKVRVAFRAQPGDFLPVTLDSLRYAYRDVRIPAGQTVEVSLTTEVGSASSMKILATLRRASPANDIAGRPVITANLEGAVLTVAEVQ